MATRKKGAAGIALAAAPKAEAPAHPATVGTVAADTAAGDVAGQALAAALGDGAIEGVSGAVQAALSEGDAAIAAAVVFAQQPGQIASVLEAPVLGIDAPEGGVTAGAGLLADGHPAEIELGGRIVMVQARAERGRWRIGRQFTRTPQPVNIDELTEDEVGRLLADPELIVSLDD